MACCGGLGCCIPPPPPWAIICWGPPSPPPPPPPCWPFKAMKQANSCGSFFSSSTICWVSAGFPFAILNFCKTWAILGSTALCGLIPGWAARTGIDIDRFICGPGVPGFPMSPDPWSHPWFGGLTPRGPAMPGPAMPGSAFSDSWPEVGVQEAAQIFACSPCVGPLERLGKQPESWAFAEGE